MPRQEACRHIFEERRANKIRERKKVKSLSHVRLFVTPWTVAYQAPLSMGFSRQEYQSGLPFPPPGDLPNPGIEPGSPALRADALPYEPEETVNQLIGQRSCVGQRQMMQVVIEIRKGPKKFYLFNILEREREVSQSCPTLRVPMNCSLPSSSVHGIFQAIVLEWIAISFSKGSSQPRDRTQVSRIVDRRFTI